MSRTIEVEDRTFEFPDDTPDEVVSRTVRNAFAAPPWGEVVRSAGTAGVSALQRQAGGLVELGGDITGIEGLQATGRGIKESADINEQLATPRNMTFPQEAVRSGLSSVVAAAPYVAGGLGVGTARALAGATGEAATAFGANVGIGGMGAGEGVRKYAESREAGLGVPRSLVHGAVEAGAEIVGEKLPVNSLLKTFKAKGFFEIVGRFLGADIVGEQLTTAIEDLNSKLSTNPNLTFDQYLRDAALTFGSTLVTGPVQTAVMLPGRMAAEALVRSRTVDAGETKLPERAPLPPPTGMIIPPEAIGYELRAQRPPDEITLTNEAMERTRGRSARAQVLTERGFVLEDSIANLPAELPLEQRMSRLAALNPDARMLGIESAEPGVASPAELIIAQEWRKRTTRRHNRLAALANEPVAPVIVDPTKSPLGYEHPFYLLSDQQRGEPEAAMLAVQFAMGGGVLNPVVEHGGDVMHRMNEFFRWPGGYEEAADRGREYVLNKTNNVLRYLTNAYGFDREFSENVRHNAESRGVPYEVFQQDLDTKLAAYAESHAKLPVYNHAQKLARDAAVAVGRKQWVVATQLYTELNALAQDKDKYIATILGRSKISEQPSQRSVVENAAALGVPAETLQLMPGEGLSERAEAANIVAAANWVNPKTGNVLLAEFEGWKPGEVTLYSERTAEPRAQAQLTKLHAIAQEWTRAFMPNARIGMRMEPATPQNGAGAWSKIGPQAYTLKVPSTGTMFDQLMTLAHEVTHGITYYNLETAPEAERVGLLDAYYDHLERAQTQTFEDYAKSAYGPKRYRQLYNLAKENGFLTMPAGEVVRRIDALQGKTGYLGSFNEWLAEQGVRYFHERRGVTPEATSFFKRVIAQMKAFYEQFVHRWTPDRTFAEWMDSVAERNAGGGEVNLATLQAEQKALRAKLLAKRVDPAVIESITDAVTGLDIVQAKALLETVDVPKRFKTKVPLPVELQMATTLMDSYTTKVITQLPQKPLVRRTTIEDLLRQSSVREVERARLQTVLAQFHGEQIDRASFVHAVLQDALTLRSVPTNQWAGHGLANVLSNLNSRMIVGWSVPTSNVWVMPLETSFANHFDRTDYFAHTRSVDHSPSATRYVYEVQSDLMQHVEAPTVDNEIDTTRLRARISALQTAREQLKNVYQTNSLDALPELVQRFVEQYSDKFPEFQEFYNLTFGNTEQRAPFSDFTTHVADMLLDAQEELQRLGGQLDPETARAVGAYRKTWFERIIREEVRKAAEDGMEHFRIATADTVARVEGWTKVPKPGEYVLSKEVVSLILNTNYTDATVGFTGNVYVSEGGVSLERSDGSWSDFGDEDGIYDIVAANVPHHFGQNQGLYNRYRTEIERFVKQTYGAKEVIYEVDDKGAAGEMVRGPYLDEIRGYRQPKYTRSTWLEFDLKPSFATDPVVLYDIPFWSRLEAAIGTESAMPADTVRFNTAVRYGLGAYQMIKMNEHVPGTVNFRQGLRNKMRYKSEWLKPANDIVDQWVFQMPKTEAAKLSRVLLDESRAGDSAETSAERSTAWFSTKAVDPEDRTKYVFRLRDEVVRQYGLAPETTELYSQVRSMFMSAADTMEKLGVLELTRVYVHDPIAAVSVQEAIRNGATPSEAALVASMYSQADPVVHRQLTAAVEELHSQYEDLRSKPYTPYMRFGQWAVRVRATREGVYKSKTYQPGQVLYMEQFEKELDMRKEFGDIKKEFEGGDTQAVASPTYIPDVVYAFGGMPPAILEAFRSRLGLSEAQLIEYKEILRDLTSSNSFAKRMKHRRGVEGYTEDVARGFADYFVKFANNVSKVQAMPELDAALGELKDYARSLEMSGNASAVNAWRLYEWLFQTKEYLKNPGNELSEVKSFVSLFYLGANVSSAALNAVQVPLVTLPYLSQRYGVTRSVVELGKAYRDVLRSWKSLDALATDEKALITFGLEDGFLNESYATAMAQISEGGALTRVQPITFGRRILNKFNHYAMLPFQLVEEMNRRVSLLATYRMARSETYEGEFDHDAYLVGRSAVEDTQNEYSIENRPVFMRGNKSVVFQFMHYTQNMLFQTLGGDASWKRLLLAQLAVGGLMGLPFMEDAKDLVKFLWRKWFGEDVDAELLAREFLTDIDANADLVLHGLTSNAFGFDLSRRVSLGAVIPGMGAIGSNRQFDKAMLDAVGDAGGAGVAVLFNIFKYVASEEPNVYKQLQLLAPSAIRNVMKSADAAISGGVTTRNNAMLAETDAFALAGMAVGFMPEKVADEQRIVSAQAETAAYWINRRSAVLNMWNYVRETRGNDPEGRADVMERVRRFNSEVPEPKLRIGADTLRESAVTRSRAHLLQERGLGTNRQLLRMNREVRSAFETEED